jgi:hypothetical protein
MRRFSENVVSEAGLPARMLPLRCEGQVMASSPVVTQAPKSRDLYHLACLRTAISRA